MTHAAQRQFLLWLQEDAIIPMAKIPRSLNALVEQLRSAGAVTVAKPDKKRTPHLVLTDPALIAQRLLHFEKVDIETGLSARADNIREHQDSKQGKEIPYLLLDLLGGESVQWYRDDATSEPVSLTPATPTYTGLILDTRDPVSQLKPAGKVLLVENREAWLLIRERLPGHLFGATILYYPGWISNRLLEILARWNRAELWLFADLDPVGFYNYKRLHEVRPDAKPLIPRLDDAFIQATGNATIWAANVGLMPSMSQWLLKAPATLRHTVEKLQRKGVAIEQEICIAAHGLTWLIDGESAT